MCEPRASHWHLTSIAEGSAKTPCHALCLCMPMYTAWSPRPKAVQPGQDCVRAQNVPRQRRAVGGVLGVSTLGRTEVRCGTRRACHCATPLSSLPAPITLTHDAVQHLPHRDKSAEEETLYSRRRATASAPSMPTPRRGCSC
eukprot:2167022-Prymnesium_polylepis.1